MFERRCNWFASWVTKLVIQIGPLTSTSMSNIKPEMRINALGSLTESPYGDSETGPIDALWNNIHLAPGGNTMTQQVNVPTFAEAMRTALAASIEHHGPCMMVCGFRNDIGQ